ncbi:MAG TPA: response regulator [Polyangiaceae bacterium]|nr:response regulator [Polyangiaceae bacterium]
MKIMVVDDDETTLRIVGAALQSRGHTVIERDTALGTTLAILREKPDIVVLDVLMPGLAGDKLASLIEQETRSPPIVLFHSSLPVEELAALVRSSGAAGYVPKGVAPRVFLDRFEQVVSTIRREAAGRSSP